MSNATYIRMCLEYNDEVSSSSFLNRVFIVFELEYWVYLKILTLCRMDAMWKIGVLRDMEIQLFLAKHNRNLDSH